MITAEELEDCDICPKKITFGSAIKFCLYFLFMLFSALLMLSFYSGRDFSSIISFDTLKFGSESIFMKKLMNTDLKYNYQERHNFSISHDEIDKTKFISQYVTESIPLIIKNATLTWKAYKQWTDNYLKDKMGNNNVSIESRTEPVIAYFLPGFKLDIFDYKTFLDKSTMHNRVTNYYYHDQSLPEVLRSDVENPNFAEMLRLEAVLISQSFNGVTVPGRSESKEQILCQIEGTSDIVIVPAMHRYGVYPYIKKYGPTNYSGADFFKGEFGRFPNFQSVQRMYIVLEKGDCFYIPSYWWYSMKTNEKNNILVTYAYKTHSRWVELLMKGIQDEEI